MARRSRRRHWAVDLFLGSAVAGAGFSFGRDSYRFAKRNAPTAIAFALAALIFAGTGYALWDLTRGHRRGPAATFLLTYVANTLLIGISLFATFATVANSAAKSIPPLPAYQVILIVLAIQAIFALLGVFVGILQRPKRIERFEIERHNERFLSAQGFRHVGGDNDTLIAPDGNELQLEDERLDALVFRVLGRRVVRAKILLDPQGRMLTYVAP